MAELHRWTGSDGQEWACGVYDHGPFCRLCQPVEGALALILANVDEGLMEFANATSSGELRFRLTEEGEQRADALVRDDPEAFDLMMRFRMTND